LQGAIGGIQRGLHAGSGIASIDDQLADIGTLLGKGIGGFL
jgi:hypothetical protein